MLSAKRAAVVVLLAGLILPALAATAKKTVKKPSAPSAAASHDKGAAQAWLKRLTLRERVAQLVMIQFYGETPNTRSKAWRDFVHHVRDTGVGGLLLINRTQNGVVRNAEPYQTAAFLNRMQRLAKIPLIVAGDFERGASMRLTGTTKFPHLMAFGAAGDTNATRLLGQATAREARALGFHWIFAPDADVNSNPDNPIINTRSFGENPQQVAEHVKAFIEGAHAPAKTRVLVTAKHFPGHGDTAVDSHLGLAKLDVDRARLDAVELVPFRAAIAAGVDSVMTAHMAVAQLEPQEIPATVSKAILTDLLRRDLKFQGIIVTDAMDMQGLSKLFPPGEAAVRALAAGTDLLLMPPKPEEVINAVLAAVQKGRLDRKRIDASVLKILTAKVQAGLDRKRLIDLEAIADELDSPEDADLAQSVADRAVTVVKNDRRTLPLPQPAAACYFVLLESRYSQVGRKLAEELRTRAPKALTLQLEPNLPQSAIGEAVESAAGCPAVVVATFVSASAYRGSVALSGAYPALLDGLLKGPAPVVLVSLGNPYLIRGYTGVAAYMTTFSTAPTAETAAVKALFGEIPIRGHSPVTIPDVAKIGDGLELPARAH